MDLPVFTCTALASGGVPGIHTALLLVLLVGNTDLHELVMRANTGHSSNAVSMLGQRRRPWDNIETALGKCLVFTGW